MLSLDPGFPWWIMIVEAPIVISVYWLLHSIKRDLERPGGRGDSSLADALSRTRDELAGFKLEVARTYVPLSLIRDVDRRLTEHLLRIEEKLEDLRRDQENRR
jgi:type III secretory pathway component EscV